MDTPLRANPGGQLAPENIVGRERLVARLWDILLRQSLVLAAERRIGKTSLLTKMRAECTADKLILYHDLERLHSTLEFTQLVCADVADYLSRRQRTMGRLQRLLTQLGGTEIGGMVRLPQVAAPHWKQLLSSALADLAEHQDRTVIMFWDELPLMLHNIKRREGEAVAMELLDLLRALRQTCPGLRMVYTGSTGLHHVLTQLRQAGYANDPTNDMHIEEVGPLEMSDAAELAARLFAGERLSVSGAPACADLIAQEVDGVPYYIHHVVDGLKYQGQQVTPESIASAVASALTHPQDPWHLAHYAERLAVYYSAVEAPLARVILDVLATAPTPLGFAELFNLCKSQLITEDAEQARKVLRWLRQDHYLRQHRDGRYSFRLTLIRRFWQLHRGLL